MNSEEMRKEENSFKHFGCFIVKIVYEMEKFRAKLNKMNVYTY